MDEEKQIHDQDPDQRQPLLHSRQEHYYKAFLLLVASTITVGSHYGRHSLSSLSPEIMTLLDSSRTEYGLLFSSQQIPGIVLPILGGFALTYIPHGPAGVFLSSCITFSTVLCALAVSRRSYGMLVLGRFIFGLCDGALTTLQGAIIANAVQERVGAGFGIMLCVSRLSSFAGLTLPAIISSMAGLEVSMWFSVVVCIPPLLSTIAYATRYFDHGTTGTGRHSDTDMPDIWSIAKSFGASYWSICYLWIVVAGVVFSMTHFIPDALYHHFKLNPVRSGFLSGSMVLAAGVTSPVFGIMQDRLGRRATIMMCCCILLLCGSVFCATAVSNTSFMGVSQIFMLYVGLVSIGIGFSAAPVTLLGSIAVVVDGGLITAALGVYKAVENAALALIHLSIGLLRDWSGQYVLSFLLLGALSLSGTWTSWILGYDPRLERGNSIRAVPDS